MVEQKLEVPEGYVDVSHHKDCGILKKIITEGSGDAQPGAGDKVSVHYIGTLEDGSKFDSSRDRGEHFKFDLGKGSVIKGWDEGVASMKKGERADFKLHWDYGYGENGSPPKIPGKSILCFNIELFSWHGDDVSPDKDGSITRSVVTAGTGFHTPNEGASVCIHLRGLCNDKQFEERDVEFVIGDGVEANILPALDDVLKKMKMGEVSKFTFEASHAFGANGDTDLGVPPNTDVVYEVTMKSFEKAKESWEMTTAEKLEQAELLKTKGANLFKKSAYQRALKCYKRVVDLLANETFDAEEDAKRQKDMTVASHNNSAMCYLKLQDYILAKSEANSVLEKDQGNTKALFRRGQALKGLCEYEEAEKSFKELIFMESENKAAHHELAQCRAKIQEQRAKDRATYAGMFTKFAAEDAKRKPAEIHPKGDDKDADLSNIGNWDNKAAEGMISIDDEKAAFEEDEVEPDSAAPVG